METRFEVISKDIELSSVENIHGYDMPRIHYHDGYEIYILEKGSRNYLIGDTLIEMKSGDVALIKPFVVHTTGGGKFKRHLISFKEKYLDVFFTDKAKARLLECFKNKKIHLNRVDCMHVAALTEKIKKDDDNFVAFAELMGMLNSAAEIDVVSDAGKPDSTISEIIKYIGVHFSTINGLEEIADEFFITKYYLCRLFKQHTGVSVIKYINTLKLQYACELLVESELSVDKIAEQCGFNSSMYFCKMFKGMIGMTPTGYRKLKG